MRMTLGCVGGAAVVERRPVMVAMATVAMLSRATLTPARRLLERFISAPPVDGFVPRLATSVPARNRGGDSALYEWACGRVRSRDEGRQPVRNPERERVGRGGSLYPTPELRYFLPGYKLPP